MLLPQPDPQRLANRAKIVKVLLAHLPPDCVVHREDELAVFACDGLSAYQQRPMVVLLPTSTEQVAVAMRLLHEHGIPVVPWGAGTGLSGGALPLRDGVTLALSRMNRVLEIDLDNRLARVQPGVTNLGITQAVQHEGFYYAPDPSSQIACSIGGNVAENSGGVHCLKYGVTTNNLLALEVVLATGEVGRRGGSGLDEAGYDLRPWPT